MTTPPRSITEIVQHGFIASALTGISVNLNDDFTLPNYLVLYLFLSQLFNLIFGIIAMSGGAMGTIVALFKQRPIRHYAGLSTLHSFAVSTAFHGKFYTLADSGA